jgi:hypothetical protein
MPRLIDSAMQAAPQSSTFYFAHRFDNVEECDATIFNKELMPVTKKTFTN